MTSSDSHLARRLAEAEARLMILKTEVDATRREVERLRAALRNQEPTDTELSPREKTATPERRDGLHPITR